MDIRVQEAPFDAGAELNRFSAGAAGAGAVVSFSGIVRDVEGRLNAMEIEHYPGMTERAIRDIADQARERWSLLDVMVIHRFGTMRPGDQIMMVATASRHRVAAFEAAEFLMDYLKSRAPFWKKEVTDEGKTWVDATQADEEALNRW
ncbi:molybdenum cofactor biosynthesis protein MoaE [Ponticoccus sp. SC2-23]|uniref:molybdenum cofactor biosynthesis protein MoaE n=1 Tax=Alexandriicola marinus TaxID=2081710 RepID=UPI000FDA5CA1|nr:molybdenum cofactor biosynthesis protein MoaE [Alexandriicola marinus]MBM1220382.1 molybdenum cofactor biosynthesis protein MoaE [Ponticoccus sp. SC6-9]MBM1225068.1 molybdenum cofactor biosynthesis protein MoaE [Ponticoccus sp. SC6-15]MBM1228582.1 molybdenum cofactor biosynthesis protein MoaE [Ponticoccus sp. SC6-38]MBM1233781.1 molybdenum cofactor biosynthesis protein MoaE [Ponticoccus sp. SC6-45]MBM1239083.1 molybdenum cofactor biosynthesis protein MoaE [Ponticoccus sp. SC6-49]MBM1242865